MTFSRNKGNESSTSSSKWKDIEHHYDHHFDQRMSKKIHRGDTASTTRLLGYTDAMMATCATFLVIPIRFLESVQSSEYSKNVRNRDSLSAFISSTTLEIIMFFLGFLIICTIWETINIRSIVVKRMDDFLVLMSILSMLFTTVIPFAIALQGYFPGEEVTIISTTVFLIFIDIVEIVITVYGFASPNILHIELKDWERSTKIDIRNSMIKMNLLNIIIVVVAALCVYLDYRLSWAMLSIVILMPLLRKIYWYVRRKFARKNGINEEHSQFFWFLTKGNIPKERVEAFTDAATAIIACVLILDITIAEFPKLHKIKAVDLWENIQHMQYELFTFFGAYISVSLLWYVNHTVVHLYHTITIAALYTQKIFLCFLSLMPLCSNILVSFTFKGHIDKDIKEGVRLASIFMFLASSCNAVLLVIGYVGKGKLLHQWALDNRTKREKQQHLYIIIKTANMPYWSFVAFLGSFSHHPYVASIIFLVCFGCMIMCFLLIKFLFVNNIGKKIINRLPTRKRRETVKRSISSRTMANRDRRIQIYNNMIANSENKITTATEMKEINTKANENNGVEFQVGEINNAESMVKENTNALRTDSNLTSNLVQNDNISEADTDDNRKPHNTNKDTMLMEDYPGENKNANNPVK